jgi:hypothetical protein
MTDLNNLQVVDVLGIAHGALRTPSAEPPARPRTVTTVAAPFQQVGRQH